MSEVESCWPEQDAVDKWLTEEGINVSFETAMRLKDAVSKHRISVDKENADLRAQLDAANAHIQVREKASMGPRQYTEFVEAELAAANKRISELEEANSILSEELLTAEGALKLSAANYKQEEGVKKFVAALEQTKRITELETHLAAANKWREEAEKEKPVYAFRRKGLDDFCTCDEWRYNELAQKPNLFEVRVFYTRPILPADVAELQRKLKDAVTENECLSASCKAATERIAELERKLAKQQAHLIDCATDYDYLQTEIDGFLNSSLIGWLRQRAATVRLAGSEELNKLLAKAREEGRKESVPDGWQAVPKEPTKEMVIASSAYRNGTAYEHYTSMLAAAPSASLNAQPSLIERIRKHLSTGAHISASDFERILMEGVE